jgi:hypothetical protein
MKGTRFVMAMGMSLGLVVIAEAAMAERGGSRASYGNSDGHMDKGNQGCTLQINGSTFSNPGKMMQYIRDNDVITSRYGGTFIAGGNVKDWRAQFEQEDGHSVGDWIRRNCAGVSY